MRIDERIVELFRIEKEKKKWIGTGWDKIVREGKEGLWKELVEKQKGLEENLWMGCTGQIKLQWDEE